VDVQQVIRLSQGWGTCGPRTKCGLREHLIWPASEFSLLNLEHNIALKRNFMARGQLAKEKFLSLTDIAFSLHFPLEDKGEWSR